MINRVFSLFIVLLIIAVALPVQAQKEQDPEKMSKKQLRRLLKRYYKNPAKFKEFKQNIEDKENKLADLEKQLQAPVNTDKIDAEIAAKTKEEAALRAEIERLKNEKKETKKVIKKETNEQGTIYKVQVEITDNDLYKEIVQGEKKAVFTGDLDSDGLKKYTLGYFKDKTEADKFVKILNELFIKAVKVVTYTDGKRID